MATRHATTLRLSAEELYRLYTELEGSKAPVFDIPTALDVLQTGKTCKQSCGFELLKHALFSQQNHVLLLLRRQL